MPRPSESKPPSSTTTQGCLHRWSFLPPRSLAGKLEGTTIVEGALNGTPLGCRSLKPWDEERWFVELRKDWCRKAGIATGDRVELVLEVALTEPPARACWAYRVSDCSNDTASKI